MGAILIIIGTMVLVYAFGVIMASLFSKISDTMKEKL